ncbi:MAG: efflux RND transporter periplasmic adaptor subunit [Candidatus Riflebacteria bacterium]
MKFLNFATVFLLTVLVVGQTGCNRSSQATATAKGKPVPAVKTVEARKIVMNNRISTTGNVIVDKQVVIQATVEGPISFCPWEEGDRVEAGQKLIEIDRPLYRQEVNLAKAALDVAKAKLADLAAGTRHEEISQAAELVKQKEQAAEFAKADYARIEALVKSGALAAEAAEKSRVDSVRCQTDLAAAREKLSMLKSGPTRTFIGIQRAAVAEAEARLGIAEAKFQECIINAPFSGIISKVKINPGDLATPRAPLIEIYDPSSIMVRFAVAESSSAKIKAGITVNVKLDAYPEKIYSAVVNKVYPELAKDSRSRLVEARVLDAPELIPGMFARVEADLESSECLAIPDAAILSTVRGERIVYVASGTSAIMRKIETGLENETMVQVLKGVADGELVITEGNRSIKNGSEIKILGNGQKAPETQQSQGEAKL